MRTGRFGNDDLTAESGATEEQTMGVSQHGTAASEGPRSYKPHFVWAVRPLKWFSANGKAPQLTWTSENVPWYIEGLNDARTKFGEGAS